ncbi:MAG: rRNA maturation RNase YbeY [bacterium]|nr:rRNA maturation RNase YbeY [bacterium]
MKQFVAFKIKVVKLFPRTFHKKLPKKTAIIAVSKKESSLFNWQYRGKKKATNVLSFRYGSDYGEILICPEIIRREAKKAGNNYNYQLTWMIIHGMVHLAGLHHEKSQLIQKKVERLEENLLGKIFGAS